MLDVMKNLSVFNSSVKLLNQDERKKSPVFAERINDIQTKMHIALEKRIDTILGLHFDFYPVIKILEVRTNIDEENNHPIICYVSDYVTLTLHLDGLNFVNYATKDVETLIKKGSWIVVRETVR